MPRLEVAEDTAWLDAFGMVPQTEEISGDDYVRELRIPTDVAEELHLTWDVTDDSVRVRHRRVGGIVVDLYREGATLLTVERNGRITALIIEYRSADAAGRARIQVTPQVVIEDKLLRSCGALIRRRSGRLLVGRMLPRARDPSMVVQV